MKTVMLRPEHGGAARLLVPHLYLVGQRVILEVRGMTHT
jgi:DMSO/TMAO reductase YedYZ molybdopterin-dependent catalytic subunit